VEVELKLLANKLGAEKKVLFAGRIEASELYKYTALANLGLSLEEDLGLNYRYALPNKLFDYIHAGVPVLVSNLPEMAALVRRYAVGEVLCERTPKALADIMEFMLFSDDKRLDWRSNCLDARKKLSWDVEKKVLYEMLETLN